MPQQYTDADIARMEKEGTATVTDPTQKPTLTDADIAALNASKTPYNPNAPPDWTPQADPVTRIVAGAGNLGAGVVGGIVRAGKALYDTANTYSGGKQDLEPETKQFYKDMWNAQTGQFDQMEDAWNRGDHSQAVGHFIAGITPGFGPAAATAAETIGGGQTLPTYDKYGNVITSGTPPDVAGGVTQGALLAGSVYAPKVISKVAPKIPASLPGGAGRAGASLDEIADAAKGYTVDASNPGQMALNIARKASTMGKTPPGIIQGFLNRITNPSLGPLTFDEAREFYTNSHLSPEEFNHNPVMKKPIAEFREALNNSLQDTANQAGSGPQYSAAIRQYRQAMATKRIAKKAIPIAAKYVLPELGSALVLKKIFSEKAQGGPILDRIPGREETLRSLTRS